MNRPEHVAGLSVRAVADRFDGRVTDLAEPTVKNDSTIFGVTGVTLDSRRVQPGDLYAALPGANVHGASFAAQACASGAVAVITDPEGERIISRDHAATVPVIVVDDPRAVLGDVSAEVYGHPSRQLAMVGITGTNGKTTTAYLVESAWRALGQVTGLIGTIETRVAGTSLRSAFTTPESPDLQGLLALMAERGVDHTVMEVSSHALALHRSDAVDFDVAVFTNLSQDHLDFHGTMEDYFEAKAMLFAPERSARGVICVDDPWGRRLADEARIPVITLRTPASRDSGTAADYTLVPDDDSGQGRFVLARSADAPAGAGADATDIGLPERIELVSALPGAHNQVNTALAALVLLSEGVAVDRIVSAMSQRPTVPGRMEHVDLPIPPGASSAPVAVVDFAHTPDAIEATLSALRPVARRRGGPLVAVLGAGGNRDHGKRPIMGSAAASIADVVVVTDDNPRHEDPAAIREAVAGGARETAGECEVLEVEGRVAGITAALERARDTGVVAVLGKGHETTQIIGATVHPFDDRVVIADAWDALVGTAAVNAAAINKEDR